MKKNMSTYNLVEVSKDEFYSVAKNLNVHPMTSKPYDQVIGYESRWETPSGHLFGVSSGIESLNNKRYWIAQY